MGELHAGTAETGVFQGERPHRRGDGDVLRRRAVHPGRVREDRAQRALRPFAEQRGAQAQERVQATVEIRGQAVGTGAAGVGHGMHERIGQQAAPGQRLGQFGALVVGGRIERVPEAAGLDQSRPGDRGDAPGTGMAQRPGDRFGERKVGGDHEHHPRMPDGRRTGPGHPDRALEPGSAPARLERKESDSAAGGAEGSPALLARAAE